MVVSKKGRCPWNLVSLYKINPADWTVSIRGGQCGGGSRAFRPFYGRKVVCVSFSSEKRRPIKGAPKETLSLCAFGRQEPAAVAAGSAGRWGFIIRRKSTA